MKYFISSRIINILILIFFFSSISFAGNPSDNKGVLRVVFKHFANGKEIVLRDSFYTNSSGETYSIKKLRYYVSNIKVGNSTFKNDEQNYHLIDLKGPTTFDLPLDAGIYNSFDFLLGVDSLRNCSGSQTGALDPVKDMFWTWNSGYVVFKLEGTSSSSTADLNRIEHHIGGYRFGNNVSTNISLKVFPNNIVINKEKLTEILIYVDLDKYWYSTNQISIADDPMCTLPGELAKKIALNFPNLFSVKSIKLL